MGIFSDRPSTAKPLTEPNRFPSGWQPLPLIITDGCAGLAAALQTVYAQGLHQRCWVHKMRSFCEAVRRRDHDRVKRDAQQIYQAASLAEARHAFRRLA
jgi:putative transposase